jgi:hypothetical protein
MYLAADFLAPSRSVGGAGVTENERGPFENIQAGASFALKVF